MAIMRFSQSISFGIIGLAFLSIRTTLLRAQTADPDEVVRRLNGIAQQISLYHNLKAADGYKQKAVDGDPCAMYVMSRIYVYGIAPEYPKAETSKGDEGGRPEMWDEYGIRSTATLPQPSKGPGLQWLKQAVAADFLPAWKGAQLVVGNSLDFGYGHVLPTTSPMYRAALMGSGTALFAVGQVMFLNENKSAVIPIESDSVLSQIMSEATAESVFGNYSVNSDTHDGGFARSKIREAGTAVLMHLALMATLQNKPLVHDDLMRRFMLEGGKAAASSACDLKTRSEKPLCLQIMSKAVEFYESAYRRAAYSPPDYTCAAYHASAVISEGDLLRLIQSKTPDSTIISLVRVNGVGFTLTPLLERRFIAAGASEEVLAAIKAADRPDPGQVRVPPLEH